MLGIRVVVKNDLNAQPTELVYGRCQRIPGELVSPLKSIDFDYGDFVERIKHHMRQLKLTPTRERVEQLDTTLDCCMSPLCSRCGCLGPAEGLGSSPTTDNLAPAMVVGRGCIHRSYYMRPRSGPGCGSHPCLTYMLF
ncbi:unnamed protein product [Echinostoma caproni]|uniref:Uncharacterized protein n=1 Tax=Echinostoma caproni TaxID=27848 RepID=A0A183AQK0_9TREM|nr:unnamed protein product [Echinostoma caproni]